MRFIRRLTNVPLRYRLPQVINAISTPFLCGAFRLTHVVEHPKCGGTWVANTIRTYIGSEVHLADRLIRPDDVLHVHRLHRRSYLKPVVVVRDPRDLFVSFYYHETRYEGREKNRVFERYFEHDPERPKREDFALYLRAKLEHRTHPPFSYSNFVKSWIDVPRACIVRYEDFLATTESELERILRFLGRPIDHAKVREAVEINRFENRTKQRDGVSRKPGESDPAKFERKGIAGDWKNHFDAESCELMEEYEHYSLTRLGYESDRSWISRYLESEEAHHS
jgi:Sulfotransferase domain